jgi:integrase
VDIPSAAEIKAIVGKLEGRWPPLMKSSIIRTSSCAGWRPVQVAAGVVTKAGKAKYTGMHALRHFYASWCINRREDGGLGLPLKVVQHRLGHPTIQMTADVYGHLFPSGDDGAEGRGRKVAVGINRLL